MKVAILETGGPPDALVPRFGRYPDMLRRLLGPGFDYADYDVAAGPLPEDPAAHEAYILTGSPAGVYEDLPWIEPLAAFVRAAGEARLVGICFGHQLMAEYMVGLAQRSGDGQDHRAGAVLGKGDVDAKYQ